jgi:hypothetical protein
LAFSWNPPTSGAPSPAGQTLYSDTNRNIGIGTLFPGAKLEIYSTSSDSILKLSRGPSSTTSTLFKLGTDSAFVINSNGADRLTISSNGNVGIGTTTPSQKLTVAGTIESTSGGIKFPDNTTQTTATQYKVGAFTRDLTLAAGTQAVTGVGFSPQAIFFMASVGGVPGRTSWGITDRTTARAMFDHHPTYADSFNLSTIPIYLTESPNVDSYGQISSFDSDGFTISWTKIGSPSGTATIFYFAFK